MRAVLDTNVVVSGVFFSGPPLEVLRACKGGRFQLVVSKEIIAEYREVLGRFAGVFTARDVAEVLAGMMDSAVVVDAPELELPICRDPFDDKFIACAVAGGADFIVSGDKDLLVLNGSLSCPVLNPRTFLKQLR